MSSIATTCLRYVPGEVLSLRVRHVEEAAKGSRFELGEVIESIPLNYPVDGRRHVLERIAVPVGLELRFLQLFARQGSTFAESLNYLGRNTSASVLNDRAVGSNDPLWMIRDSSSAPSLSDSPPALEPWRPLIVAVDTSPAHCSQVLEAAAAALKLYQRRSSDMLVGICGSITATTFGLYEYLKLAAKLIDLDRCPDALVMSVDFGIACLEPTEVGGANPIDGLGSLASYSFPVFEVAMQLITEALATKSSALSDMTGIIARPPIFAAAGNSDAVVGKRQRLAYPALRPEIVAVTHAAQSDEQSDWGPSVTSDLPLCHDLKPIFGVPEELARTNQAPVNGTSFAAPWCAAWYTSVRMNLDPADPINRALAAPLARMATLQRLCRPGRLVSEIKGVKRSTPICLLPSDSLYIGASDSKLAVAAAILSDLNATFPKWEFAITGSAPALLVAAMDREGPASPEPSDIDLTYSGNETLEKSEYDKICELAAIKLGSMFGRPKVDIELTSTAGRVAPFALFQSVIPSAAMFLTAGGLLDAWQGRADIEGGSISVLDPTPGTLFRHPHAISEQYARLPSLLVAMSLTCRLQTAWLRFPRGNFPDLAHPCEELLRSALREDLVPRWTQRLRDRLNKFTAAMSQYIDAVRDVRPGSSAAQNFRRALSALRDAVAEVKEGAELSHDLSAFLGKARDFEQLF